MKKTLLALCAGVLLNCGMEMDKIELNPLKSPEMELKEEIGMTDFFQIPVVNGKLLSEQFINKNYDGQPEFYSKVYDTNNNSIEDYATYHRVRKDANGVWEYQIQPYAYMFNSNEDNHVDTEFFDMNVDGIIEEVVIHHLNPKVKK